jgi:hypothetical protein
MKLKAELPIKGDRIDYFYDTVSNEHTAIFAMSGTVYTGTAGAIANVLAPHRGYRWINELFQFLCK